MKDMVGNGDFFNAKGENKEDVIKYSILDNNQVKKKNCLEKLCKKDWQDTKSRISRGLWKSSDSKPATTSKFLTKSLLSSPA